MTRNDTFLKILFAIEVALVPMVIFAYLFLPEWSMGIFVAGILLTKICVELFKNKLNKTHVIMIAVGNIFIFTTLLIFFIVQNLINMPLAIVVIVLIWLFNILNVLMRNKTMPDIISAVDYCYVLFEILTLIAFTFLVFSSLVTYIGLYAILLTTAVSVVYKIYFEIRYDSIFDKMFKRKRK